MTMLALQLLHDHLVIYISTLIIGEENDGSPSNPMVQVVSRVDC